MQFKCTVAEPVNPVKVSKDQGRINAISKRLIFLVICVHKLVLFLHKT